MAGGHKAIFSLGENSNSNASIPGQAPTTRSTFSGRGQADNNTTANGNSSRHSILGKRPSLRSSATEAAGNNNHVNRSTSGLSLPKLRLNTGSASTANLSSTSPHEGIEGHHFSSSKLAKLFKPHHNQRRTPVEPGQPLEGRLLDSRPSVTRRTSKPTSSAFDSSNATPMSSSPGTVSRSNTVTSTSSPPSNGSGSTNNNNNNIPQAEAAKRLPSIKSGSPSPSNKRAPLLSACPIVSNAAPSMNRNNRAYSLPRSGIRQSPFNPNSLNIPWGSGVGSKNQVLSSKAFLPPGFEPPTEMLTHKYQEISYLPQESQKIGEGATAVVRQMQSIDTHRICAVKEFRKKSPTESDESYYSQLASEYMLAKSLHHTNIVATYNLVLTPVQHQWCHVMEFCDGGDVFSLIQQLGPTNIGPSERNCLFKQLLLGVEFIHRSGIAHRDIKPENLLLSSDRVLKISDFGVSDLICEHPEEFDAPIKLCRDLCGSEPYTAPEIFATKKYKLAYDGRLSDVWSCAIVFFCLSFGGNPFKKAVVSEDKKYGNFVSRMEKYCRDHPEDCKQDGGGPLFQNDNLPFMAGFSLFSRPALRLIYRMMQPDPSKRCTSYEAITDSWLSEVELCCKDTEKPPNEPVPGERRVPLPGYGPEYLPLEEYQKRLTEENNGIPVSVIPRPISLTDLRAVGSPASPYFLPMKRDDGHPNHAFVDGPGRPMSPQSGETSNSNNNNNTTTNNLPHVKSGLIAGIVSRPGAATDRPTYNRTPSSGSSSYIDITKNEDGKEDKSKVVPGDDKKSLEESLAHLSLSRVPEHDEDANSGGGGSDTRSERAESLKSMLFDDGHHQSNNNNINGDSSHQDIVSRARGNSSSVLTPTSTSSSNNSTINNGKEGGSGSTSGTTPPGLLRARSPSSLSMSSASRSRSPFTSNGTSNNNNNNDVARRSTRSSSTSLSRKPKHEHIPPVFKKKSTFFIGTL